MALILHFIYTVANMEPEPKMKYQDFEPGSTFQINIFNPMYKLDTNHISTYLIAFWCEQTTVHLQISLALKKTMEIKSASVQLGKFE